MVSRAEASQAPAFVRPMAAEPVKRLPEGRQWLYAFLGLRMDKAAREVRRES